MLLRSITLTNFRQYRGRQTLRFSTDPQKNVTVILGLNTSGKTTLVQAFHWALYGRALFTTKDFLLNLDVSYAMDVHQAETVEVEIVLTHNDMDYTLTRSQVYRCDTRGVVRPDNARAKLSYKESTGQTQTIRQVDIEKTINEILPDDLADYFFFDGERIETIGHRQGLTEAVKRLMGLAVLENARQHLDPKRNGSVVGKWQRSFDPAGDQRAAAAMKEIENARAKLQKLDDDKAQMEEETAYYESEQQRIQKILQDNQETMQWQKDKQQLEEDIARDTDDLERQYKLFRETFNTSAAALFSRPLIVRALDALEAVHLHDAGIPNMNGTAIDFLIQRGRCLCGAEILPQSVVYQHLLQERALLPPESLGTVIRTFRREAAAYNGTVETLIANMEDAYQRICTLQDTISDTQDAIDRIHQKLLHSVDMGQYEAKLKDITGILRQLKLAAEELLKQTGRASSEFDRYQKEYQNLVQATEKGRHIKRFIQYAEAIYEWINVTYLEQEEHIRAQLEERVNRIFNQMYHGHRTVSIDEKYRVSLGTPLGNNWVTTDESRGLETVKNFAFVAGLVDLARAKIITVAGETPADLGSEPYPLVMDAPFSSADERHVSSISAVLPTIAEQVILVVMVKDWQYAEPTLGPRVGIVYELEKQSETTTMIREVASHV